MFRSTGGAKARSPPNRLMPVAGAHHLNGRTPNRSGAAPILSGGNGRPDIHAAAHYGRLPGPTGQNSCDEGRLGNARVLLAEHFTSSTRFVLLTDSSSDQITIELTYSFPVHFSFQLIDATGIEMAIAVLAYTRATAD